MKDQGFSENLTLDTRKKRKEKKIWKATIKYSSVHSNGNINFWVIE